jgi:hypothetical protein
MFSITFSVLFHAMMGTPERKANSSRSVHEAEKQAESRINEIKSELRQSVA